MFTSNQLITSKGARGNFILRPGMNNEEEELQEENMKTQQLKPNVDVFITPSLQSVTTEHCM